MPVLIDYELSLSMEVVKSGRSALRRQRGTGGDTIQNPKAYNPLLGKHPEWR